jgi:excisionase family DNA binding protein
MNEELRASLDELKKLTLLSAKNVLCFDDVVLLTGLSKSHLYKLTCSHQIPHYKPNNKHIYFDRAELENWMKQNRIATTMETAQVATEYLITGRIK